MGTSLSLICLFAAPAYALDDLGVVSGDTFELPGYNDGPSGGGVWPGSSGSGGVVGTMPLPNETPDDVDSPRGGPGGGAGSGELLKPDLTRPPYLSPRDRNTPANQVPFSAVRGGCAKASALSAGTVATLVYSQLDGPTINSAGPDETPADQIQRRRAESAITSHLADFLEQTRRLTSTVAMANANVFATDKLDRSQIDRITRQYFDTLGAWEVLYNQGIDPYVKNAFDCDHVIACKALKSVRARAALTMYQMWQATEQALKARAEIEKLLSKFHFLPLEFRDRLDEIANKLGLNPAASREAERRFQLQATESWQDFSRRVLDWDRH